MLLTSRASRRVIQWPVMMSLFSGLILFGGVATLRDEGGVGAWFMLAFALVVALLTLAQYRVIVARDGQLCIANPYGRRALPLGAVALGISVHRGSRGSTYTVYAQHDGGREDLVDTWTEGGAKRAQETLDGVLLRDRPPDASLASNTAKVEAREAHWRSQDAQAQAAAQQSAPRAAWLVAGILFAVSLIAAVVTAVIASR